MTTKSPNAFRSIGEVARLLGVATHVLRYWETQFTILRPTKRADGRRYYRPDDVMLAAGICEALREEGLTIRGTKRLIAMDRGAGLRARGVQRLGLAAKEATDEPPPPKRAAKPKRAAPRPAPVAPPETLPLFPDLDLPPVNPAPKVAAPASPWLARLSATAAALRGRDAPVPDDARPLAAALREAHAAAAAARP